MSFSIRLSPDLYWNYLQRLGAVYYLLSPQSGRKLSPSGGLTAKQPPAAVLAPLYSESCNIWFCAAAA